MAGARRKRGGRGIAAGAGHEHGLARRAGGGCARQVVGEQLGQAERRAREQVGAVWGVLYQRS